MGEMMRLASATAGSSSKTYTVCSTYRPCFVFFGQAKKCEAFMNTLLGNSDAMNKMKRYKASASAGPPK